MSKCSGMCTFSQAFCKSFFSYGKKLENIVKLLIFSYLIC